MKQVVILAIAVAMLSCSAEPKSQQSESDPHLHGHDITGLAGHSDLVISLDNGKRWKADAQMNQEVQSMKKTITAFDGNRLEDYHVLGQKLNDHTHQLIASCTMKGQGHDELHKWLHPFMQDIEKLTSAESVADAVMITDELESSLAVYDQHFE